MDPKSEKRDEQPTINEEEEDFKRKYYTYGLIGCSRFKTVYQGKKFADGLAVEIKRVEFGQVLEWEGESGAQIPKVISILQKLADVPGVKKMIESFNCGKYFLIIMEKLANSVSLQQYIFRKGGLLKEADTRELLQQLLEVIIACQEQEVVHRDINLNTILVDFETAKLHLTDFGFATYITNECTCGFLGSVLYSPPEWMITKHYSPGKGTAWTIGVIMYYMLYGNLPFTYAHEISMHDFQFQQGVQLSPSCKDFLTACLKRLPSERSSLEFLLAHPWIVQNFGDALPVRYACKEPEKDKCK